MKLIMGSTAKETTGLIDKAISSIKSRGKKLDNDIHVAACSCINHIELHGDVTLLNRLIEAMPKGSRVNALRDFVGSFAKVDYNEETKAFDYNKKKVTLLQEAMEISWVEFKPEQPYKPMDFTEEISKILRKAFDRVGSDKGDKVNAKKLREVAKVVGYKEEA